MSALERRTELMQLAATLNDHRVQLAATIHQINVATALLVNEAEKLLIEAVTEKDEGPVAVRKVTTKVPTQLDHIAAKGRVRTCSNCGGPGHDARTCTNPRKIDVNDEGDVVKPPKTKRTLSPEQKAVLAQRLVKARAARKKAK